MYFIRFGVYLGVKSVLRENSEISVKLYYANLRTLDLFVARITLVQPVCKRLKVSAYELQVLR